MNLNDPISPLYLIILPIIIFAFNKFDSRGKIMVLYSFLATLIWYLSLEKQGGRFILPYLPVVSILAAYSIFKLKEAQIKTVIIIVVVIVGLSSIAYRAAANEKFIPVILRKETKTQFLAKNLNFSFGDFYDTDELLSKPH